jgi:two-component system response regulator QseB
MKLLLIEDERRFAETVARGLREEGHSVDLCHEGADARRQAATIDYDVIVLDWMLPDLDGITLLRDWRREGLRVPVLMLTARGTVGERVTGLRAGADDYLVKPFDVDELKARIRALLRRSGGRLSERVELGELVMDLDAQEVKKSGESIPLTRREFTVLRELLLHLGKVLTRERLEQAVYGWEEDVESNALEVHIHHLRKKLGSELIRTVRGVGYIIEQRD